jgi:tetratricopeptide (TPR) repeat protein
LYELISDAQGPIFQSISGIFQKRAKLVNAVARRIHLLNIAKGDLDLRIEFMEKLASEYAALGRFRRAELLRNRALEIESRMRGPESTAMMYSLISLGDFFRDAALFMPDGVDRQAAYASAVSAYKRARAIGEKKDAAEGILDALEHQAESYLEQTNFSEAEPLYQQALQLRERTLGPDPNKKSPSARAGVAANLDGLARSEVGLKKYVEAEAYFRRAQQVFDGMSDTEIKTLNFSAVNAVVLRQTTRARLAELYRSLGRLKEADEQYKPLAERLKPITPEDLINGRTFQDYLDIIERAGRFYSQQGEAATAEKFYQLLLPKDAPERLLNAVPDSCAESMLRILRSYAETLEKLGNKKEASNVGDMASILQKRLQGDRETAALLP